MKKIDNLQIVERLLELAKNNLTYNEFPGEFKKEYIFLANILNYALTNLEREFNDRFRYCVNRYKLSLEEERGYGWFNDPEKLLYINMQMNQLKYAIYGERHIRELKFNEDLKELAYLDLINQIDCTVLMTPEQLKKHNDECNKIAMEIVKEILDEQKK